MITKNQFEKSAIFLKDAVPRFVRNTYSGYTSILKEIVDMIVKLYETNPYTAVRVTHAFLHGDIDIISLYSKFAGSNVCNYTLAKLVNNTKVLKDGNCIDTDLRADEAFYNKSSPDIIAPVESINLSISSFSGFNDLFKEKYNERFECVPVSFSIDDIAYYRDEPLSKGDAGFINSSAIEGFLGEKTILDSLKSTCNVDIIRLFNIFTKSLTSLYSNLYKFERESEFGESEEERASKEMARLKEFSNLAVQVGESSAIQDMIDKASSMLSISVISTYFVFASKLIGAKEDVFSWAYKSFIKDSISKIEMAKYPNRADVEYYINYNPQPISETDKNIQNINASQNSLDNESLTDTKLSRVFIYRNLRMSYSSWASILNTIFSFSYNRKVRSLNSSDELYKMFKVTYDPLEVSSFKTNAEFTKLLSSASTALLEYLRTRYRTYNVSIQRDFESEKPYKSSSVISKSVALVKDEEASNAIKAILSNEVSKFTTIDSAFIPHSDKTETIISINDRCTKYVSHIFLKISYLILLNFLHTHLAHTTTEKDPITGKTKQQLFEEIYYGITSSLKKSIDQYGDYPSIDSIKAINKLEDGIILCTPYIRDGNECCFYRECGRFTKKEIDNALSTLEFTARSVITDDIKEKQDKLNDHYDQIKLFIDDISDIPFFKECGKIKKVFSFDYLHKSLNSYDSPEDLIENKITGSEIFPKNKLITEYIGKLNYNPVRAFKSLESLDNEISSIESLTDLGIEGMDGMGSNSGYAALGSLGGAVCSLELSNDKSETPITIETNPGSEVVGNSLDGEGYSVGNDKTDSRGDQLNFTTGTYNVTSNESAHAAIERNIEDECRTSVIERYNKLFNKFIVGIK